MRKVRKEDLEDLITKFYCKFLAHISVDEHSNLPIAKKVKVNVKSTHILVWWEFDDSDSKLDMESAVKDFTKAIEDITLENLKVKYHGIEKLKYSSIAEIYIAYEYEVID